MAQARVMASIYPSPTELQRHKNEVNRSIKSGLFKQMGMLETTRKSKAITATGRGGL
jgi:hypothetical protein